MIKKILDNHPKFKERIKFIIGGICVISAIIIALRLSRDETFNKSSSKIYPEYKDITHKEIIFGTIEPLKEIKIKSRISGILEKLYIQEGNKIKKGTPIGRIKPLPNPQNIEKAKTEFNVAKLNVQLANKEYKRAKKLIKDHIISRQEFQNVENKYKKAKENLEGATKYLNLVKKGYFKGQEQESNMVTSTIDGTVLELPFKEGSSITERSINNEGSTIAVIADMNEMIFKGEVNEKEAANLKEGMLFKISINAIDKKQLPAIITKISPKGKLINGIIKFPIEGRIKQKIHGQKIIRAGYKAIAEIIIEEKKSVLVISENYLKFEDNKYYVDIDINGNKVKKYVEIGISDGINVEITKGLTDKDVIFEDK